MYTDAMLAEDIAMMGKNEFFEWLSCQMERNDPNGEYSKDWIAKHPIETLSILFQWVEDCGGVNFCYRWIYLSITKLNVMVKKGSV